MKIQKNGQLKAPHIVEYHVEPDGSLWEQVFWHNNPADTTNLFKKTDTFSVGAYHNENAWLNFNVCKDLTSWEFLVIQKTTSDGTLTKYRWIQTKSPFTATWEDVEPTKVTKNTSSGYSNGTGGFYVMNSQIYMCCANSSKGNWFGVGCWTAYQGGYPSVANTTVTTGHCAVFVRVSPKAKKYKSIGFLETVEINEV